ncbi:alpha-ketoglutarate-dependent dioxygenase AlkB family protein [Kangiella sediminilitoris]|uniref:2OG-Fe(II) oxygenase n=1 Tax=Kangiella sediminilitoris TaxID=1144748 RepID=A0A1B3BCB6_9GAMM|nr:alpha-ketoglutarate-dependent dioxygenase AlkB [Kangiella sediminilitoris]AOE50422.1 2OG-Fe(II) oxygenase [Kangiella sediminilitoris]
MQQFDLNLSSGVEQIELPVDDEHRKEGAIVKFQSDYLGPQQAIDFYNKLYKQVDWQKETLWIFGEERLVPRLVAWYGDPEAEYRYSGKLHKPLPWIRPLQDIKEQLEQTLGCCFNSVLCNLYRDGSDSMGWHADDERELGSNPVIASVSLGAKRAFHLKHKKNPKLRHKMSLTSGSLLVMQGATQKFWLHQVPKEPKITEARINLTFRKVIL